MTVAIAVMIAIMVLAMLVIFPVVGLAMIPIGRRWGRVALAGGEAWRAGAAGAPRSGRARYVST